MLSLLSSTTLGSGWTVLDKTFSAVSIGIAFHDENTGYTTFTDGSSAPQIVKTTNAGLNWTAVGSGSVVMPMGFAASHDSSTHVASVGVLSNDYSTDGTTFQKSRLGPFASQSVKYEAGRFVAAKTDGAAHSTTGALWTSTSKPALKYPGTGRYVASPSKDVIYLTAGQWPHAPPPPPSAGANTVKLTRNLRVHHSDKWMSARFEPVGAEASDLSVEANTTGYTAELWKSEDDGKTWASLLSVDGEFYFNDISCADDNTCIAVGEGFSQDGSTSPVRRPPPLTPPATYCPPPSPPPPTHPTPQRASLLAAASPSQGARVYVTTDGKTFAKKYQGEDGSSLMAAKSISATEHWAGGISKAGAAFAPTLALHSTDTGATWANDPSTSKVTGQMITAMDFVGGVGYATTVNGLQISSLLKYSAAASK